MKLRINENNNSITKVSNDLTTEGVKNTIKSGAIYCPFDEKKQAFIVPDEFLDDWEI